MSRAASIFYYCLSAMGGFLVFSAIWEYWFFGLPCILFAWRAYAKIEDKKNKTILLSFSLIDILVGLLVGLFFPDPLGVTVTGIIILMFAYIINLIFIWKIYESEDEFEG